MTIDDLLSIMRRLRDPESGCPWDVAQDFDSIAPYTIEEAYEVADAIDRQAWDDLRDELGDLLFQVVFHAQMAREAGLFDFPDVVAAICDKMLRRHPHVFGDAAIEDAQAQTRAWEEHKAREREAHPDQSALAGVATGLPEWMRALKLQRRAGRVGFDWADAEGVLNKLDEELDELQQARRSGDEQAVEDEFGDLLFTVLNLARHLEIDPGRALRRTNQRFEQRFRAMEAAAGGADSFAGLASEQKEALWRQAKDREDT